MARLGDRAPGTPDGVTFASASGLDATINNHGQVAMLANLFGTGVDPNGPQGVWFGTPGNMTLVARAQPAGGNKASIVELRLNDHGMVVYQTNTTSGPTSYADGLWIGTSATVSAVARRGGQVPGGASATFTTIGDPVLDPLDRVSFYAETSVPSGSALFNTGGVFVRGADGGVKVTYPNGVHAPGTESGIVFSKLLPAATNRRGQILVRGKLAGPGITSLNDDGLWASFAGRLYLVAREHDDVDVGNGQILRMGGLWLFPPGGTGEDGSLRAINDNGQLAFQSSSAFLIAQVPTTIPGDANLDGAVNITDVRAFLANYAPGVGGKTLATGDFNADGFADFRDYQILESNFGRAVEDLPPVGAAEFAAFEQLAASVPEPTAIACAALGGLLLIRPRTPRRMTIRH